MSPYCRHYIQIDSVELAVRATSHARLRHYPDVSCYRRHRPPPNRHRRRPRRPHRPQAQHACEVVRIRGGGLGDAEIAHENLGRSRGPHRHCASESAKGRAQPGEHAVVATFGDLLAAFGGELAQQLLLAR